MFVVLGCVGFVGCVGLGVWVVVSWEMFGGFFRVLVGLKNSIGAQVLGACLVLGGCCVVSYCVGLCCFIRRRLAWITFSRVFIRGWSGSICSRWTISSSAFMIRRWCCWIRGFGGVGVFMVGAPWCYFVV